MSRRSHPDDVDKKRYSLTRLFSRHSSHGLKSTGATEGTEGSSSPKTETLGKKSSATTTTTAAATTPPPAPEHPEDSKDVGPKKGSDDGSPSTALAVTEKDGDTGGAGDAGEPHASTAKSTHSADKAEEEKEGVADAKGTKPHGHHRRRSLWEAAFKSPDLGDERRALLDAEWKDMDALNSAKEDPQRLVDHVTLNSAKEDPQRLVDHVIDLTQDKLKVYTARWGDVDKKTVPQAARKILLSALRFKDLIDPILKFDPTGYGSSAWAVVSFGLKLAQYNKENMDQTFEACGYLADLMAWYSRMEANYWKRGVERGEPLEEAIIRVYTAILIYSAEVKESVESDGFNRWRRIFTRLTEDPLRDLRSAIDRESATVQLWQQLIDQERHDEDTERLQKIEKETDGIVLHVTQTAKEIKEVILSTSHEEQLGKLNEWLLGIESPAGQNTTREDLVSKIQDGEGSEKDDTDDGEDGEKGIEDEKESRDGPEGGDDQRFGHWLLAGEEYRTWKRYPQGVLWLHGKSGCGKSALCTTIIQDLEDAFYADESKVLAYWYFSFDFEESKNIELVYASLLRQLAMKCKGFHDDKTFQWFLSCQKSGRRPKKMNLLSRYLNSFISEIDKDVFIVLDGLDQVPTRSSGPTKSSGRAKLLGLITKLIEAQYPNLHVLLVSRYEEDIAASLKSLGDALVSEKIEDGLEGDLDNFIRKKLDTMNLLKGNDDLKSVVETRLNGAGQDRNFLWATSVLADVANCHEVKKIQEVLTKIPTSIAVVYETALKNVKKGDEERMKSILLWLLHQLRPLSQDELAAAVELANPDLVTDICTRVLVDSSKQEVTVTRKTRDLHVFRFADFSVQEYLRSVAQGTLEKLEEKPEIARFDLSGQDAHLEITKRCLAVLSACCSHGNHKDSDADTIDDSNSESDATTTDADSETDDENTDDGQGGGSAEKPLLKYAAEYWFCHYTMIDRDSALKEELKKLDDQIWASVLWDDEVRGFWLRIFDPDDEPGSHVSASGRHRASPVYYAVKLGFAGIPEQLVAHIPLPSAQNDVRPDSETPDSMIDGLDPDERHEDMLDRPGLEGTALQLVAHNTQFEILDALIQRGVDVDARPGPHGTALYASAATGNEGCVRRLLNANATVDGTEDGELGSPLHAAAYFGHDTVVTLLIEEGGVHVDHKCGPFGTALQAASALRKHKTIEVLLKKDADPNIVSGCFGTAAQAAATHLGLDRLSLKYSDKVLNALRKKGAPFVEKFNFWKTAYEKAITRESQDGGNRIISPYREVESWVEHAYMRLLLAYGPIHPNLRDLSLRELSRSQQLFVSIKHQWMLPAKRQLTRIHAFDDLLCRIPFQDQLDAILQLAPGGEATLQDLSDSDFAHKALFCSGLNLILDDLGDLIVECMDQVETEIRHARKAYERGHERELRLPSHAFWWAFVESAPRHVRPSKPWSTRMRLQFRVFGRKKEPYSRIGQDWDTDSEDLRDTSYEARSDLVAMSLLQLKQAREQEMQRSGKVDDGPNEALLLSGTGSSETGERTLIWLTSDVLDLVKDLLEYVHNCIGYQDAVSGLNEIPLDQRQPIEDLTFEIFSTVIRLVLAFDRRQRDERWRFNAAKIGSRVQLLKTIRLERIRRLDARCKMQLSLTFSPKPMPITTTGPQGAKDNNNNKNSKNDSHGPREVQDIAAELTRHVEGVISGQIVANTDKMVSQVQSQISGVISQEVSRLAQQMEKDMQQRIRDEVQRQVAVVHEIEAGAGGLAAGVTRWLQREWPSMVPFGVFLLSIVWGYIFGSRSGG